MNRVVKLSVVRVKPNHNERELFFELWRDYFNGKMPCAYCKVETIEPNDKIKDVRVFDNGRTIDHIRPLSKGGKHIYENMVIACHKCNTNKGDSLDWKPFYCVQQAYFIQPVRQKEFFKNRYPIAESNKCQD